MRYKDYKRLSKISLKARKKTTRSTVRGISFGLILLMPLLFIVIAFHLDLNKEVNKDASIRVFNISYVKELPLNSSYISTMKEEYSENVYEIKGIENIIKYNQYTFSNSRERWDDGSSTYYNVSPFSVTIGEKSFTLDYYINEYTQDTQIKNSVGLTVIDTSIGNSVFIQADKEVSNNNHLIAGEELSDDSLKEIMISSNFLTQYSLSIEDVLNKTISLMYELDLTNKATTSKTDTDSNSSLSPYRDIPVTIFKDYKVVGIFDSNIYKSATRLDSQNADGYQEHQKYETYFWISKDSIESSVGSNYLPEYIKIEKENQNGDVYYESRYYYNDNPVSMSKTARNNERVFIPLGMGASEYSQNDNVPSYTTIIAFKTYADANNAVAVINSLYKAGAAGIEDPYISSGFASDTFTNYRMFYNAFTYLCIVLAVFGGVVFFATLLNLYNTIHYSVQSRRNYLGMIRAIGMRGSDVIKMYFVEVFQIFKRSYIWTAIFGGSICFGISALFNIIMKSDMAQVITINLSLNPIYILVAFAMLIIVNTIISIVFSLVACHNVSSKPILEVLVENR